MSAIKGGELAFPVAIWSNDQMRYIDSGMTLRDYFAAKAMKVTIEINEHNVSEINARLIARLSYMVADAMLKARES